MAADKEPKPEEAEAPKGDAKDPLAGVKKGGGKKKAKRGSRGSKGDAADGDDPNDPHKANIEPLEDMLGMSAYDARARRGNGGPARVEGRRSSRRRLTTADGVPSKIVSPRRGRFQDARRGRFNNMLA